jgi:hypothetical protein
MLVRPFVERICSCIVGTKIILAAAMFLSWAGLTPRAAAQSADGERIDLSRRGPQVGETIPDFTLRDQFGETWTRESILAPGGTMLVFIRSADW